jgi:glycosyltransferase involved in cell wall biosynthesis
MELRPAAEGFSGIPQDTRLLYSMFRGMSEYETVGLLNSHRRLLPTPPALTDDMARTLFDASRLVLHLQDSQRVRSSALPARIANKAGYIVNHAYQVGLLRLMTAIGRSRSVYDVNAAPFFDFVWRSYLAKSLPATELAAHRNAKFATIRPGWMALQMSGVRVFGPPRYPSLNTDGYGVFLSQTPWPGRVSRGTQLVVRYHDAIPIFCPHTIHNPQWHQYTHYFPLRDNLRQGAIIACNSEQSRSQLLELFPSAGDQSVVLPCVVSDAFLSRSGKKSVREIIRANLEPTTELRFNSATERERFYDKNLSDTKPFKYLVMVSTIEPRKNHSLLIAAWQELVAELAPELKLIIVGRPGWHCEDTLALMARFQRRGQLFNLSGVAASDLGALYRNAEAVVCPSLAEGFDLTGTEAMLAGGVVAASDIAVHREIYGDGCVYFDPYSTSAATKAIAELLGDGSEATRSQLLAAGEKIASKYLARAVSPQWDKFLSSINTSKSKRPHEKARRQMAE